MSNEHAGECLYCFKMTKSPCTRKDDAVKCDYREYFSRGPVEEKAPTSTLHR